MSPRSSIAIDVFQENYHNIRNIYDKALSEDRILAHFNAASVDPSSIPEPTSILGLITLGIEFILCRNAPNLTNQGVLRSS
ncbi:MAG TPA: hypothetical protein DCF68_03775 [Cyanothece sp. UBA12306]|nr:hypothetical protein [Cyanothece sp. UBA12306]